MIARSKEIQIPVGFFLFALLMILSALGVVAIIYSTSLGAGLGDDSYFYIRPARDILNGETLKLDPSFPPLLPILLVVLGIFELDPQVGIRYLNAICFGINMLLFGLLLWKITSSRVVTILGACLFLLSETLITTHSMAMSESIFMTFFLMGALSFGVYFEKKRLVWLALAGILFGLGALSRYIGISLIAGGVISFWMFDRAGWRSKLRTIFIFTLLAASPILIYMLRNWIIAGNLMGPRPFGASSLNRFNENLGWSIYNILIWFIPGRFVKGREVVSFISLLLLGTLGSIAYQYFRGEIAQQIWQRITKIPYVGFFFWSAVFNFSILAFSAIFLNPGFFDSRYLSPIYLSILFLLIVGIYGVWQHESRMIRASICVAFVAFLAISAYRSYDTIIKLHREGSGYAAARWHVSETIAFLNKHPDVPVVSSAPYGIYFWTGRLPLPINHFGSIPALYNYLREENAFLVLIDSMPAELYGYNKDDLIVDAKILYQFSEGAVYLVP
jgi:4-amino-4-deoxy-L-arabinose transferase-like glycosyltransferase